MGGVPIRPRRAGVAVAALTALLVSGCSGPAQRPDPTPGPTGASAAAERPRRDTGRRPGRPGRRAGRDPHRRGPGRPGADAVRLRQTRRPKVSPGSAAGNQALGRRRHPGRDDRQVPARRADPGRLQRRRPDRRNQETTNVDNPKQVRELTAGLRDAAGRLAAGPAPLPDRHRPGVRRGHPGHRRGHHRCPAPLAAGAAGDPELTEAAWRAAGTELAAMGINVDFAPVADVLATRSTVIGSRSFGADPKQRRRAGRAARSGACRPPASRPPSSTSRGTATAPTTRHEDLPVLAPVRARSCRAAAPAAVPGRHATPARWPVMSGHLDVQAIDPGTPATFSHKLLTDVLRGQLGFTGRGDHRRDEHAAREAVAARRGRGPGAERRQRPDPDDPERRPGVRRAARRAARRVAAPDPAGRGGHPGADHEVPAAGRPAAEPMSTLDTAGAPGGGGRACRRGGHRAARRLRRARSAGPVTVTASEGRDGTRAALTAALTKAGVTGEAERRHGGPPGRLRRRHR